jgi:hypothetical protein
LRVQPDQGSKQITRVIVGIQQRVRPEALNCQRKNVRETYALANGEADLPIR